MAPNFVQKGRESRKKRRPSGITVTDQNGNSYGQSKVAAKHAVGQVVAQRIACAIPAMVAPLVGMMYIEKKFPQFLKRSKLASPLTQVALVGLGLLVGNPITCALFQQQAPIKSDFLELEFRSETSQTLYYNKGL